MKKIVTLYFLLLAILLQSNIGHTQTFKTVGYLPTYRFSLIDNIELEKLTHLNIAFANPDAAGNLQTGGVSITSVVQQAHDAGLQVFIALAGGSGTLADWEDWIAPANRSAFVSGIVDYVAEHNLQGVDVDLEWGMVTNDYSGFVLELIDSLKQYDYDISVALPGTYRYPEVTDEALAAFDWVNLMVYDLTGPWAPNSPGPHSPYSFAENSISYWVSQGLEKERMTLGVPFYGYDFTNQNNVVSVKFSDMVALDPDYAQLDQVGEIYYNGLVTIAQKTTLALNQLSGVMIWELGQDDFSEYSLLSKIDKTIEDFLISPTHEADNFVEAMVYPNPVSDFATLRIDAPGELRVTLFSPSLTILKTDRYTNQKEIGIQMGNYPQGLYLLTVEGAGFVKTFKVVKI